MYTGAMHTVGVKRNAFSLVELSIVLVILGLLVGGVLSGQSLIKAAQLRSVSTDYMKFVAANNAFRDKYFAAPGDMSNATQFWGRANATASCVTNSGAAVNATTGVCDGNGDGKIDPPAAPCNPSVPGEDIQFWRQLQLAGLIEGNISGFTNLAGNFADPLVSPASKISTGYWTVANSFTTYFGPSGTFPNQVLGTNTLYMNTPFGCGNYGKPLIPEDMWNIDKKLDDGNALNGKVVSDITWSSGHPCSDGATGNYYVDSSEQRCSFAGVM